MRPVDLVLGAAHAFFDRTFDNLTGAPLLVLQDFTKAAAVAAPAAYTYFRNGQVWGPSTAPPLPQPVGNVPAGGPPHVFPPSPYVIPPRNLGLTNRDNSGPIILHAQILTIQKPGIGAMSRRFRVLITPGEATDLVRAWNDGNWNGAPPLAIPQGISDFVWGVISSTDTVPSGAPPAGQFYGYRGAIRDLEAAIGGYCSFCESKRQDGPTLDVEHRVAKAFYQSEILRWDNFLLGCRVCNSSFKNDLPDREFGIRAAVNAYHGGAGVVYAGGNVSPVIPPGPAVVPYFEMRSACDENHLWPNLDDGGTPNAPIAANPANPTNYSLVTMRYRLRAYSAAGVPAPNFIPIADSVNLDNQFVGDGPNGTIIANVWDSAAVPPALQQVFVRVEAIPANPNTGNAAFNARKVAAATNTINMVGLNSVAHAFGDRRMLERTIAWLRAIENLRLLRDQLRILTAWQNRWRLTQRIMQALGGVAPDVNFQNDQWTLVASAAEGGYYSVWITVFKAFSQANNLPNDNLVVSLATRLNARAAADTTYRYKGTNLNNSVLAMIPSL